MLSVGTEAEIFLSAVCSGGVVLLSYRVLALVRRIMPHGSLAVGLEDLVFWLAASGYLFRQMYVTTYGSIRWFFALGVVCGVFLAYSAGILAKKIYVRTKKSLEKFRKNR